MGLLAQASNATTMVIPVPADRFPAVQGSRQLVDPQARPGPSFSNDDSTPPPSPKQRQSSARLWSNESAPKPTILHIFFAREAQSFFPLRLSQIIASSITPHLVCGHFNCYLRTQGLSSPTKAPPRLSTPYRHHQAARRQLRSALPRRMRLLSQKWRHKHLSKLSTLRNGPLAAFTSLTSQVSCRGTSSDK